MSGPEFDLNRAREFADRMMGLLNGTAIVQLVSLGDRTGLFDAMAQLGPATSDEVALAANLSERYVRECLSGLSAGGVVVYEPTGRTFHLPAEHAACLTRAAAPRNLAQMAKYMLSLSQVEPLLANCFRDGGGVPYPAFTEFHQLQREWSSAVQDATLIDVVLPLVPGLVERLDAGLRVADVGCGAGHAVNLMAGAFPRSTFIGYDFSDEAIGMARAEATAMGLGNAQFLTRDVAELGEVDRFDLIASFDAIHDQAHPDKVVKAIAAALAPEGVWLCVEPGGSSDLAENLANPMAPYFYASSTMHCMSVSLAYDGAGLGMVWGQDRALQMFGDAGFNNISVHAIAEDVVNNYYVCRR